MGNPQLDLTRRYIESTGVSLFLTGKAGTGKTTFLRQIDAETGKRHIIVAPTGVAAINAGGTTIHSFFQLPFDPYLPDVKELLTAYQLPESRKALSRTKRDIIRTLELLIIDEVSMVRADLLDAVDHVLRRYRRSSLPFGGVQLLMIGDVHQLPPVVTDREKPYLERVYPSPFFFHSKALQRLPYVTIELTHVYRQHDEAFVRLLNEVRSGNLSQSVLQAFNSRAGLQPHPSAITLTTHNHQADSINRQRMMALGSESRWFEAVTTGTFADGQTPVDSRMELKVGERVMFAKNDSAGKHRYYNGKLGTIVGFGDSEAVVTVEVEDDEGNRISVGHERWERLRYSLSPTDGKITQEVEGTFSQYPLRPAWAVTIHKAQGLTFDHVAIDAAEAFAFGQVYVALSRCRTLDGIVLTTPLTAGEAIGDSHVEQFVGSQPTFEQAAGSIEAHEAQYRYEQLAGLFDVGAMQHAVERLRMAYTPLRNLYPSQAEEVGRVGEALTDLASVSERFTRQLARLDADGQQKRASEGAVYYSQKVAEMIEALKPLTAIEIDNREHHKALQEAIVDLREAFGVKIACLEAVVRDGFSVPVLQKARAAALLGHRASKGAASAAPATNTLEARLRQWRREQASKEHKPVFMVLQQKALLALAEAAPTTLRQLGQVSGIGTKTVERYGQELLAVIKGE